MSEETAKRIAEALEEIAKKQQQGVHWLIELHRLLRAKL